MKNKKHKKDSSVVFIVRNWAIFYSVLLILLELMILNATRLPFEPDVPWAKWSFLIYLFIGILYLLFISIVNVNSKVILTKDSITILGRITDFEDTLSDDIKLSIRQMFAGKRQIEMKWSDIEKVYHRRGQFYFYTKSGQRLRFSTFFFDLKIRSAIIDKIFKNDIDYMIYHSWWR